MLARRKRWAKALPVPLIVVAAAVSSPRATAQASAMDQRFVMNAAAAGMAEVKFGQLAEQRASNPQVKQFGQKMMADHAAANEKLQAAGTKQGISTPIEMSAENQATYDKLSRLSGAQFDKAYMADMIRDHKLDISDFEREARNGSDPAVKQFAAQTLPTLREHLQLAEKTERSMSSSGTSGM